MKGFFEIGKIVNTHGVQGAVKVIPTTDDPTRFEKLKDVTVKTKSEYRILHIKKIQYVKHLLIISFDEIKNMNEAQLIKNSIILIPREKALPLEEDEYYISDLYGLNVVTEDGRALGEIKDIIFTGANEVYVVKGEKEILIPAIKECIKNIDLDQKVMTVSLMKGLID